MTPPLWVVGNPINLALGRLFSRKAPGGPDVLHQRGALKLSCPLLRSPKKKGLKMSLPGLVPPLKTCAQKWWRNRPPRGVSETERLGDTRRETQTPIKRGPPKISGDPLPWGQRGQNRTLVIAPRRFLKGFNLKKGNPPPGFFAQGKPACWAPKTFLPRGKDYLAN